MINIKLKESFDTLSEIKKLIGRMKEDPLRIGHFPKPVITYNKKWNLNWICTSDEKNPYSNCEQIVCSGHGNTVQEAYDDWLQTYANDIIYDEYLDEDK